MRNRKRIRRANDFWRRAAWQRVWSHRGPGSDVEASSRFEAPSSELIRALPDTHAIEEGGLVKARPSLLPERPIKNQARGFQSSSNQYPLQRQASLACGAQARQNFICQLWRTAVASEQLRRNGRGSRLQIACIVAVWML